MLRGKTPSQTLFDKLWDSHTISTVADGRSLLFVDRHIIHDASSPQAFSDLNQRNLQVAHPHRTFATADHTVPTISTGASSWQKSGGKMVEALRDQCRFHGIQFFDVGSPSQGIVHVTFPEHGTILPGSSVCCGDSHTSTLGALGALALAIGTSEITQILATQTIFRKKPKNMSICLSGQLAQGVYAKDVILALVAKIGANGARGYAVEFMGSLVQNMDIEERFTLCNMAAEMGAVTAVIQPDESTIAYMAQLEHGPKDGLFDMAIAHWRSLQSDPDAAFDHSVSLDVTNLDPQISWGTNPDQAIGITSNVPQPSCEFDEHLKKPNDQSLETGALTYMGLSAGQSLENLPIDVVFIGSCTNARLSDLRIAANLVAGKTVPSSVQAIVVPGSSQVRLQAQREGIDQIFKEAGFEWRQSGCSMCAALNSDRMKPFQRCVSTSNRNYEGRQGRGSRTHLASPATAAACAIVGKIVDVRSFESQ